MQYIIPLMLIAVLAAALLRKQPVYEQFTDGAGEGLKMLVRIVPPVIAVVTAVYMMRASGLFDRALNFIAPVTDFIGIPSEVMPLAIIRPLSGSGAIGVFADILNQYGADSDIGKIASIICGSTETTFYCLCVYFSMTRVKNNLKVIPCALLGDITGIIVGVLTVKLFNF